VTEPKVDQRAVFRSWRRCFVWTLLAGIPMGWIVVFLMEAIGRTMFGIGTPDNRLFELAQSVACLAVLACISYYTYLATVMGLLRRAGVAEE
jgi:Na+-driven multidrug efflux pump